MAKQTEIGSLAINLQIKLDALEKGIDTAKKKLQEIEKQNEQVKNSNKGLDASFIAMSASIIASLVKIKSALDDGVAEYTKYKNSMMTVNKVAQNTGTTLNEVQNIINKSNEFKLMNESDLNASIKNLLLYGYTAEQAIDILKRLQDSAVGNRQECYSLSEAVRVTTEGIRMENSVTSDAAGVQKNIAKMYEEHAEKLGKTTDSLTQAEKAQAVYNGIMEETAPIVGSAAQIAGEYEGQQAQANAEMLKTKQLLGESLIPTYNELSKVQKNILSGLNNMIKDNKSATAGIVTLTTTLLATTVAVMSVKKAVTAFSEATGIATASTKALTGAVMANPLFIGGVVLSVGLSVLNAINTELQKSLDLMNENIELSKQSAELIQSFQENKFTYTETESIQAQNIINETQQIISSYQERKDKIEEIQNKINEIKSTDFSGENPQLPILERQLEGAKEELQKFQDENLAGADNVELLEKRIKSLNMTLDLNSAKKDYNTVTNAKATRQQLIDIAQTKSDIQNKQRLLNILKEGKTTTDAYTDAKSQLVKVYPELAKVNENTIASTQSAIDAENKATDAEWENAQTAIQASLMQAQAISSNYFQIQKIAVATQQTVEEVTASLQNQISVLSSLANLTSSDFKGSIDKTTYTPKASKSSKSYQNKALDEYKKQIEYKKSLDQISLSEEISMYETALKRYAKTQDEKMELTTKIYELKKELQQKELDNDREQIEYMVSMNKISKEEELGKYEWELKNLAKTAEQKRELEVKIYDLKKELADKERELLNQKTEDYKQYIEDQKNLRGAEYSVKEQEQDLNKIIELHRNYLNQIMTDERYSLEERKSIYREELDIIRDYEQQKRDLRISSINDTVSHLKSALTKQIEEMQKADEEAINKNIEAVEKWKDARIDAINEEYDARIKAIQAELDALDKAEQQKTRDEEDTDYEKKRKRLEELIAYEHDETTKANYIKELEKLNQDYQKTVDKRVLQDKKDSLKEKQELLKEEQTAKIEAINEEAERIKEQYQTQLNTIKEYYNKQKEMAEETAQKLLLNAEENQNQIINLLQSYGDMYAIIGQSFGEKLGQNFADTAMEKIQNAISRMRQVIDNAIESNIARLEASARSVSASTEGGTTISKTVNVEQHNTITSPVDSPYTAYKKQETLNRNLANQIAGLF